jgi:hypothetical protein
MDLVRYGSATPHIQHNPVIKKNQTEYAPERNPHMSVDIITPENVSVELLNGILAAYLDITFDEDGFLLVKGDCSVYVTVTPDKSAIRLVTVFRMKDESSPEERFAAVNRINSDYMIKAYCSEDNKLIFSDYFLLAGGLTRKAFMLGTKRFDSIPRAAISVHAEHLIS